MFKELKSKLSNLFAGKSEGKVTAKESKESKTAYDDAAIFEMMGNSVVAKKVRRHIRQYMEANQYTWEVCGIIVNWEYTKGGSMKFVVDIFTPNPGAIIGIDGAHIRGLAAYLSKNMQAAFTLRCNRKFDPFDQDPVVMMDPGYHNTYKKQQAPQTTLQNTPQNE